MTARRISKPPEKSSREDSQKPAPAAGNDNIITQPKQLPTLEQIEAIGFPEFVKRNCQFSAFSSYSDPGNGDQALRLLNAIAPILAAKRLTYRQYFEKNALECRRFYEHCGLIEPEDRYVSRSPKVRAGELD